MSVEPPSAPPPETATEDLGGRSPDAAVAVEPPRGSLVGRTLGKFTISERLGRGGSGEVFRAEQAALGRSAVIKVLRSDLAPSPHRVERFLREARLASRLDHPYAAHIYAFGAEPDGLLWIAMEHVRGTTLDELIARRGPMPALVFAPLFERLCEVVHSAHELGIIHRDIKLANVMVIERAGQLLPKLLDFGIAKLGPAEVIDTDAALPDEPGLTGHGAMIGSPPYMAPEQWQRPHEVDGRADIYALGVLAYRCLSGRAPIPGKTRAELAHAHVHVQPPPLAVGPPALDEAIRKALAKLPADRWPRALDLAAGVRKAVGAGVAEAVPILDGMLRDVWERGGPQPIADAVSRIASAVTTVEADAAVRDLVDVTCRWLAAVALAGCSDVFDPARKSQPRFGRPPSSTPELERAATPAPDPAMAALRERTRELAGRDDGAAWFAVARAACDVAPALPELPGVLAGATALADLAGRQSRGQRSRTAGDLAADVAALADALAPLEPLLAYRLVIGGEDGAETWVGVRRRNRPRALVWGDAVAVGEVVLLDGTGRIAVRLTPLVRAQRPLPHADLELFLIARTGKGAARLAATPWGYEQDDEEAGRLLASLSTVDSTQTEALDDERSPYPGLAAYGVDDADRFFGREREIDALANRLVRSPMVAVVGPSGVGKSSFVHAGVVARLSEHYRVITLRPGRHPTEALRGAIERTADETLEPAADLADHLRRLGESADRGVVVIVDQLEEIVSLCGDAADRERFARALGDAAAASTAPVRVVATVRDDFASLLESIDGFRDRFEVFVLGAPSPDALRRILIEPARRAQVGLEHGLVDDIVAEIAGRAAALPLLGFTAARLWQLRDRESRMLTRGAYQTIGGVAGALATYADEVFASLGKREQDIARDLFGRLVAADGTRVPMPRSELASAEATAAVVDRLIEARLLTAREADARDAESTADGEDLVEIVHECLAERWPRLARWRSEDAAARALHADVRAAARRWEDQGKPGDLLWRGAALDDLRRLAERSTSMTPRERAFAEASIAAARLRQRARRTAVVAVMVVLVGVAAVMAYLGQAANESADQAAASEKSARTAAELAEARLTQQLRAAGQRELVDGRPINALAYLAEVLRRGLDDPALRVMVGQVAWSWPLEERTIPGLDLIAIAPDRSWLAVTDGPRKYLALVDGHGAELARFDVGGFAQELVTDPTGQHFIVFAESTVELVSRAKPDKRIVLFDERRADEDVFTGCLSRDAATVVRTDGMIYVFGLDGKERRRAKSELGPFVQPTCNRTGTRLLVTSPKRTTLLDLPSLRPVWETPSTIAQWGEFSDDGTLFLLTDKETVEVHDATGVVRQRWPVGAGKRRLWVSPDGKRIALAGEREAMIYTPDGRLVTRLAGFRGGLGAVHFEADELWTGGADGFVRRWRADGVQLAAMVGAGGGVRQVIRTKDGLVAMSTDGMRIWRGLPSQVDTAAMPACEEEALYTAASRALIATPCTNGPIFLHDFDSGATAKLTDHTAIWELGVQLDPSGRYVATTGEDSRLRVFDTKTGAPLHDVGGLGKQVVAMGWHGAERVLLVTDDELERPDLTADGAPPVEAKLVAFDLATEKLTTLPFVVRTLAIMLYPIADGQLLIVDYEGVLTVVKDGATLVTEKKTGIGQNGPSPLVDISLDRKRLALGTPNGTVAIFALPSLEQVGKIDAPGTTFTRLTIDHDGGMVVTITSDRRALLWDVAGGDTITSLALGEAPLLDADFVGADDQLVLYAGEHMSRLRLPRAPGTAAALAEEIACRVKLRPEGGRLVPYQPKCPH